MKTTFITRMLCVAILGISMIGSAIAGPTHEVYRPVNTVTEARNIPVGTRIALSCNNGGPITLVTVDEKRDYLRGFTCPVSKHLYRFAPGGSGHNSDQFLYKTDSGLTAHLLTFGKL